GGAAAAGADAAAEQVELRIDVGQPLRLEDLAPGHLGGMQDGADEGLLLRIDLGRHATLGGSRGLHAALIQQGQRILEEDPAQDGQHDQAAQPHPTAASTTEPPTAAPATVDLDVVAAAAFLPVHKI